MADILADLRRQMPLAASARTRDRPLPSGIDALDRALAGGLPRRAITEVGGERASAGRAALALRVLASATARGEACAWIDGTDGFHALSAHAAGVDLARVLWVRGASGQAAKACDLVLEAGGFGLVVLDARGPSHTPSDGLMQHVPSDGLMQPRAPLPAARLARRAETSSATLLILGDTPLCGAFASTRLALDARPRWRERSLGALVARVRVVRARGAREGAEIAIDFGT